jgi:hypothetical protein
MGSRVNIANQALMMLGASPIVSFDDGSTEAIAVNTLYEPAKSQVLRAYPWRCATNAATLALLADAPVNPLYEYAYAWPEDAVRILNIMVDGNRHMTNIAWETQGKTVLANVQNIMATYVYDVEEPDLDAHVEMALVAKLAMDMCYTLTASNTREGALAQIFEMKLNEARTTDRQEASHKVFGIDQLQQVRR